MCKKTFNDNKKAVTQHIREDLHGYRIDDYKLHLFETSSPNVITGIVWVPSLLCPKYLVFLSSLRRNHIGREEYYVTNKEHTLKFHDGKVQVPYCSTLRRKGPIEIINL